MSTFEERLACLEQVSANLFVRTAELEDKVKLAFDRIRELESVERAALLAYIKTHPKVADDLDRLDLVLNSFRPT
jgi:hypothetical protein